MKTSVASSTRIASVAFLAGVLFALGLIVAGMTKPAKVIGFLDVGGAWDPSLAFVMIGAIGVHFITRRLVLRRSSPIAGRSFDEPKRKDIDAPLVVGAAIFGVGWGVSGYCPGPALVALGSGSLAAVVFVLAMAAGMLLQNAVRARLRSWTARDVDVVRNEALPTQAHADG